MTMHDTATIVRMARKRAPNSTPANLRRTVQRWCKALGYKRVGHDWWIDDAQVKEVLAHILPRAGDPTWGGR